MLALSTPIPLEAQSHLVVRVTEASARNPNEVSVAINPADPRNLVAASRAHAPGGSRRSTSYHYLSTDGGRSWLTSRASNPEERIQGDDAVAFSRAGVVHHSYIAFKGLREVAPAEAVNGIFVTTSADRGRTWSEPVAVVDHLNTVEPFEDKPYLAADRVPGSPHLGNVYIAWTRFDVYGSADPEDRSQIYFSRSVDAGRTFAVPIRVSDLGGDCLDSDGTVEGAVPAVGVDGEVFLVWAGPQGLSFDVSRDGGRSFGADRVIGQTPGGWDIDVVGLGRHNGMPVTGVDRSRGPHRGNLYVNWIDERFGDPDVFVTATPDGGETWTEPVRVNDDAIGNGRAQMFTWMAVDPVDGAINVVFYDRRSFDDGRTGLTLARSVDGGRTFVNHRVDLEPFETNANVFFGDYTGIDAYDGFVVPVFMHFIDREEMAISAALFHFVPGTQQLEPVP